MSKFHTVGTEADKVPEYNAFKTTNHMTLASITTYLAKLLRVYDLFKNDLGKMQGKTYDSKNKAEYENDWRNLKESLDKEEQKIFEEVKQRRGLEIKSIYDLFNISDLEGVKDEKDLEIEKLQKELLEAIEKLKAHQDENKETEGWENAKVELEEKVEKLELACKIAKLETLMATGVRERDDKKSYRIDGKTPVFSEGMNVRRWVKNLEENFLLAQIPEEFKMIAITQYVGKGSAKSIHENFKSKGKSWEEFKEHMLNFFESKFALDRLRDKLGNLKQGDGPNGYSEYVCAFTDLEEQIGDRMDEEQKLYYFKKGLKNGVFRHINNITPEVKTVVEAIERGRTNEETRMRPSNEVRVNSVNVVNKKKFFRRNRGDNKEKICYTCNEKGHISPECPKKTEKRWKNNGSNRSFRRQNRSQGGRNNKTCYSCNEVGHLARDCKKARKTDNMTVANVMEVNVLSLEEEGKNKIITITGKFPRYGNVECGLDTGAETSVLSKRYVQKVGIPILPSSVRVKGANNVISKVVGKTPVLQLKIANTVTSLEFVILESDGHECLLGMDFFEQSRAIIDPHNRSIRFAGETIEEIEDEEREILITEITDNPEVSPMEDWPSEKEVSDPKSVQKEIEPVSKDLTREERKLVEKLLMEIRKRKIFANTIAELGACNLLPHKITLSDSEPVYTPPYRKSLKERKELNEIIAELLKFGLIKESRSPYSSPVILIPKKDGKSKRMVIDYRKLNKKMVQQIFPIPRLFEILERVSMSKYYSGIDLKNGYWQQLIEPGSTHFTAFTTEDGHFEWLRVPQGLKNAPADFCKLMNTVFSQDKSFTEFFLDDLMVHSRTFDDHCKHLKIVIGRLEEANLKLNPDKCTFFATELKILGHVVSHMKIKVDSSKVDAVRLWGTPRNMKQVQQFLGLANYYRYFVENFAKIAKPLHNLVGKDRPFLWTIECTIAFEELKKRLTEAPILRTPDPEKEFYLYTDASGYACGATLTQKDENGKEYVVGYYSKLFSGAELNYTISEKECLAILRGIKNWHIYLYGVHFFVITDHYALKWLLTIKNPQGRLARWSIMVSIYDFEIIHRAGRIHGSVDGLSRPVLPVL